MILNIDIIGVIIAAAVAGIGSGIGVAIGNLLFKTLMEEKLNKFLDKKHRAEALKKLSEIDPQKSILFGNGRSIDSGSVIKNMLGDDKR